MTFAGLAKLLLLAVAIVGLAQGRLPADLPIFWSDEFDGAAGTQPDQSKWGYHIGDGTGHGLPGWGNSELEYYTSDPVNAQYDGNGNLVITATPDGASVYSCWYGPCQYTSGRLFTNCKFTHAYGRFEARLKTPTGQGTWPGFWMLGDNYDNLGWPNSGEIDIMELRGSDPNSIAGTIHGPGYSGSAGITASYSLPNGASFADDFHIFAVEWEPDTISWFVDDTNFVTHTPADLNGNQWVFDHPFYFLLSFAVGGNFDGNPGPDTIFPQYYTLDYVRVYGNGTAPDTTTTTPHTTVTTTPGTTTTNSGTNNRDAYKNIEVESADEQQGTTSETCSDTGGGQDVASISDGDYLVIKGVDFGTGGPLGVEVRYASGVTAGETGDIFFRVDSVDGPYFGQFGLGSTGGWQKWLSVSGSVSPPPIGKHDLYLTFSSDQTEAFVSINWVLFTQ